MVAQTFYNEVMYAMRSIIDAAAGGTLMSKTEDESYNLNEEMVLNSYQWSNQIGQSKRAGGEFDVDALTLLTVKMDATTQRFDCLKLIMVNACAPLLTCDSCSSFDHLMSFILGEI